MKIIQLILSVIEYYLEIFQEKIWNSPSRSGCAEEGWKSFPALMLVTYSGEVSSMTNMMKVKPRHINQIPVSLPMASRQQCSQEEFSPRGRGLAGRVQAYLLRENQQQTWRLWGPH